jgi:hypothetical protein
VETKIFLNKGWRNIKPEEPVNTTRAIHSFCSSNSLRDSLFKSQGGYYKLQLDGTLLFVTRTLAEISFSDLFNILKD